MKDLLTGFDSFLPDPSRFPVAMAALFLTALIGMITGPMHGNANPFLWKVLNGVFGSLGVRLDRPQRSPHDLMARGIIFTFIIMVLFFVLGQTAEKLAADYPLGGITEIFLLSLAMTSGTVWFALLQLYFARRDNKIVPGAFHAIAFSSRTDLSGADDFGITRTAMGFSTAAFDKGVAGPAIWFLILGLPGAYIYAGLAALAWRFGKAGFTRGFGAGPLALERLMGIVPGIFAGIIIALAGLFTPTGGMTRALHGLVKTRMPYVQGGLPLAALAYALRVSLGGPETDLDGSIIKREWVGPEAATARLENGHLRRAIYMSLMAHMLFLAAMLGAMIWARLIGGV